MLQNLLLKYVFIFLLFQSCLSEITCVNSKLQQLIYSGRSHLCTTVIKPRIKPWMDAFQSASHIITEVCFISVCSNTINS